MTAHQTVVVAALFTGVTLACPAASSTPDTKGWLVAIRTATGKVDARFPSPRGAFSRVEAVAPDGHGGWFVGGKFTSLGGAECPYLAHVRPSGDADRDWCPKPDGFEVRFLARSGATLYVVGDFKQIAGRERRGFAALDVTTGRATAWRAPPAVERNDGVPDALAVGAGRVFVANNQNLFALDARTGRAVRWRPRLDANGCIGACYLIVCAMVVNGSSVYIAGDFRHVDGARRVGLAAVDARTARPTGWHADTDEGAVLAPFVGGVNCDDTNWALALVKRTLYVTGDFVRINGTGRPGLAALDSRTGAVKRWVGRLPSGLSPSHLAASTTSVVFAYLNAAGYGIRLVDRVTGRRVVWTHTIRQCCIAAVATGRRRVVVGG